MPIEAEVVSILFKEIMIYHMVISNGDLTKDEVEGRVRSMLISSEVKDALRVQSHWGAANHCLT